MATFTRSARQKGAMPAQKAQRPPMPPAEARQAPPPSARVHVGAGGCLVGPELRPGATAPELVREKRPL